MPAHVEAAARYQQRFIRCRGWRDKLANQREDAFAACQGSTSWRAKRTNGDYEVALSSVDVGSYKSRVGLQAGQWPYRC
jgi:hypothetical protein